MCAELWSNYKNFSETAAQVDFIQTPVTTSLLAVLQTEAKNVQALWSLANKAFSPYNALRVRSDELHSPQKDKKETFFSVCDGNSAFGYHAASD